MEGVPVSKIFISGVIFLVSLVLFAQPNNEKNLVVLHTNDIHARVLGTTEKDSMCTPSERMKSSCFGGFDRIFTQVEAERAKHKNIILLDAGDQFQGTMFHQIYQGLVSARFMNRIGYDAMAVGNHEFDNGPQVLADFISALKFPILSANINITHDKYLKNKIKPWVIIKKNNIKIGVIGYTTEDTAFLSNPGPTIKFLPIEQKVREAVGELKRAKVDVIIALSHAGLARDIHIAKTIDGIAAIVCGHSNSLLSNKAANNDGPSPLVIASPSKKPVLLVSAYAYGKYLGFLDFFFNAQGVPTKWVAEPILLDNTIARNAEMGEQALKYYEPIASLEKEQIGFASVDIMGLECRFQECVIGNFISDAMLHFVDKLGVDLALMNAGGIRASIPKGPVNRGQIKEVLPFEKKLVLFKLKGSVIQAILEHSVAYAEDKKNDNTGRFLQVAGIKYAFDPAKARGARIWAIQIYDKMLKKYENIDLNKTYGVVTNSYMAKGGDDYTFFEQSQEKWSLDVELKELLDNFFKSPFSQLPKKEGRIIRGPKQVTKLGAS
jgi:5'-nucleotidase